ncbi:MAG: hypothetical protein KDI11_06895 [Alphaproteobacteria bacterium]|nr:hypothetical protein [Alphaproteobacteria bacterium]
MSAVITHSDTGVIHRLMHVDTRYFQGGMLCLAILIYGAWGSPTPDMPGALELLIAALLAVGVGISGFIGAFIFRAKAPGWKQAGQILLIFGLSVPLLSGLWAGYERGFIIRDLVAFGFMVLPVFLSPLMQVQASMGRFLLYAAVALGLLFALRASFDVPGMAAGEALFYLANMPSVLFAAVFLGGTAMQIFVRDFTLHATLTAFALLALAGVSLWSMIEMQQRASLGVFVLSMVCIYGLCLWRNARRSFVLVCFLVVLVVFLWPEIGDVLNDMERKTALVGGNMRVEEWRAVWGEISVHPLSLFLGQGWGATFSSPAVADIQVNYTHGLLSSLLLKTGLIGFFLGGVYLLALARTGLRLFAHAPVLALALAGPILIDVFLYASFKSLDFGLMLALVVACGFYGDGKAGSVETDASVLYAGKTIKG